MMEGFLEALFVFEEVAEAGRREEEEEVVVEVVEEEDEDEDEESATRARINDSGDE